jgi:hypothetical protein
MRAPIAVSPVRRTVTIAAVLVVLALVVLAGTQLRAQQPDPRQVVTLAVGQADAVCAVGTVGDPNASPSPSPSAAPTTPAFPDPSSVVPPTPSSSVTSDPSLTPAATPAATTSASTTSPPPVVASAPAATPGSASPSASKTSGEVPTLRPGLSPTAAPSSGAPTPEGSPSAAETPVPTPAATLAPLPSATASAASGSVVVVASGPTDPGTDDPTGRVTLGLLGQDQTDVTVDRQGRGATLDRATAPVQLLAEGTIAPTAVGAVLSRSSDGPEAGLQAAPCLVASTSAWLPGLASGASDRTELVLSNPDDAGATVDLAFYGRNGRVAVPGSPGVDVPARGSRSVSLSGLVDAEGPLTASVQATTGRVAVAARRVRTAGDQPAGADWVVPAAVPARSVVVPAVPGDDGARELVVTNPGELRTTVNVSVLGLQGPFAPVGAETLELGPQSSGTVALADGLDGTGSGVALTSDQPVTAAVVSTSARGNAQPDIAVQPATPPLVRTGVGAVATTRNADAELVVSNAATTDVSVHFSVRSLQGVELRGGDILLAAGGSATRRLASPAPSYVVVQVPDGSSVTGGVDLVEPDGDVAGLASIPLVSPDTSGPAPVVEQDPAAGR